MFAFLTQRVRASLAWEETAAQQRDLLIQELHHEGLGSGQLEDDPATVTRHALTYDLVRASALSPETSLALIESVAEDDAHGDQQP